MAPLQCWMSHSSFIAIHDPGGYVHVERKKPSLSGQKPKENFTSEKCY